jgi:ADP-ribosyl-[dinitrogen reductase] hydrolase
MKEMQVRNFIKDALFGVAIGDALGVPVEFLTRETLNRFPVINMREFGSHHQPAGTWSDDSSLTFCLAEMLCKKFNLADLANRFINWREYAYWTAHNQVFDVGIATSAAIQNLIGGTVPTLAGGNNEGSNGNGSLMRILPLIFFIKDKTIQERFRYISDVSSLTHRHIRSVVACFIYCEYALLLLQGIEKMKAFRMMQQSVNQFLKEEPICSEYEINKFHRLLENPINDYKIIPIYQYEENEIYSSGYVLHTLEAAFWCILNTDNFKDAVLKAVNLGSDTDTTGAVTGGLAGILYGWETIPEDWIEVLAKKEDIADLSIRLYKKIYE